MEISSFLEDGRGEPLERSSTYSLSRVKTSIMAAIREMSQYEATPVSDILAAGAGLGVALLLPCLLGFMAMCLASVLAVSTVVRLDADGWLLEGQGEEYKNIRQGRDEKVQDEAPMAPSLPITERRLRFILHGALSRVCFLLVFSHVVFAATAYDHFITCPSVSVALFGNFSCVVAGGNLTGGGYLLAFIFLLIVVRPPVLSAERVHLDNEELRLGIEIERKNYEII
mmetsp:Transcript_6318/g.9718  ORF Transcript_6318/g.9718 Transcript_6318/m.9718 type:complete len:227 (-) Transcript_6318:646-1326(-)